MLEIPWYIGLLIPGIFFIFGWVTSALFTSEKYETRCRRCKDYDEYDFI